MSKEAIDFCTRYINAHAPEDRPAAILRMLAIAREVGLIK